MGIDLYDHQRRAVKSMKDGCILVGKVGSGKSRTALSYYYTKYSGKLDGSEAMKDPADLYIITTAKKRDNGEWKDELAPFRMFEGAGNGDGYSVTIDSWNNIKKYAEVKNAFFIFDEQRVVGSGAWVKAFIKIARANKWILLSATPGDTWIDYAPVFVANGYYRNLTDFSRQHVVYSRFAKYPKVDHYVGIPQLIRERERTLVHMNYERANDPDRIYKTVAVAYDKSKYESARKRRWDIFKNEPCKDASSLCSVLRRITNEDVTRVWAIEEILQKHQRVIIFYNFNYELDILKEIARSNGVGVAEWNGHAHEQIPNGDRWVYLVQYSAGAEGWNCIETNCIIFYSQNYSYKIMTQAAGRIDRLNTPYSKLYYYTLRSSSSIDAAIRKCLDEKRNFNEKEFVGGE